MNDTKFKPIGVVHTKGSDAEVREKGNLEGELEIYPGFEEGLQGIVGFSQDCKFQIAVSAILGRVIPFIARKNGAEAGMRLARLFI